jgi:hypothetical protein
MISPFNRQQSAMPQHGLLTVRIASVLVVLLIAAINSFTPDRWRFHGDWKLISEDSLPYEQDTGSKLTKLMPNN